MSISSKEIKTWRWGNNVATKRRSNTPAPNKAALRKRELRAQDRTQYLTTRGFIFGNYNHSYSAYSELVKEAKKDFPYLKDEDFDLEIMRRSQYREGFIYISFLLSNAIRRKKGYKWQDVTNRSWE